MPITVTHIIDGGSVQNTKDGLIVTEVYLVEGLDTTRPSTVRNYDALTATGIPRIDSNHPQIIGVTVNSVVPQPWPKNSKASCRVVVTYRSPQYGGGEIPQIEFDATLQQGTTMYAADGTPLTVNYVSNIANLPLPNKNPNDPAFNPATLTAYNDSPGGANLGIGPMLTDYGRATIWENRPILRFTLIRNVSPRAWQKTFLRRLNKTAWQGEAARYWFCRSITGQKLFGFNGPDRWRTQVTFIGCAPYPEDKGWDSIIIFKDQRTGRTPPGINPRADIQANAAATSGNGWKKIVMLGEADFNGMGFPDATT